MLWEVTILPKEGSDADCARVREEINLLTHSRIGDDLVLGNAHGYLLEGNLTSEQVQQLVTELLVDPLTQEYVFQSIPASGECQPPDFRTDTVLAHHQGANVPPSPFTVTVLLKPGVMDPVAQSVTYAARDLGIPLESVSTFRRYYLSQPLTSPLAPNSSPLAKVIANDAIERIVEGPLAVDHLTVGTDYAFRLIRVPIRCLDDAGLQQLSRVGQLSLNLAEMRAIQAHFRRLERDPTDVELETLAQTWSEHCSHKTLKGKIDFNGRLIDNLLKETIFGATQEVRRRLGAADWCVSVFEDNAGVVRFNDKYHVCFKVETHNHPSAIEPYGGANTGLGGVIRDPLGTGLGGKPICNTDVFCFAPPDTPPEALPPGVLHPRKVMKGVVAGVRDYGNRMGIPTVNGAVCFDDRYLANPLVFCGTVGLIPVDRCHKLPQPGDLIVTVGGRTGRDGIHGATFSSLELTAESDKVSGSAVQIGNAITEKKLLDVVLQARDRGLYHAITDCGAGGFSSAVGEMGEHLGAVVHLDKAPLKYAGLSYTEIWISESQERMVLAVPPDRWPDLQALCASEDVEATVIGTFEETGRLRLFYRGEQVADLEMKFLHDGRPDVIRKATWKAEAPASAAITSSPRQVDFNTTLLKILASLNVCSKEWIIRQYDHEVQGGSAIKPLVGIQNDGPGDAAVIYPLDAMLDCASARSRDSACLNHYLALAIGCGINPRYGDLDPYGMAASVIDEAVRNVVAVGADPARIALLDNFCWGNTDRPEVLGSLVRAAEACRDVALAYNMPFISGKDSLNNEYHGRDRHIVIPPTLLISALGRVPDVRRCVTMDLKEPGNFLFLIGVTKNELGGSHYHLVNELRGGRVPRPDLQLAPSIFHKLHAAIQAGLIRSCHDLSEGGLAVAIAEMAFAGEVGADVDLGKANRLSDRLEHNEEILLFSESTTRFVVEVSPTSAAALADCFGSAIPFTRIGQTVKEARLRVAGSTGEWVIWASLSDLKEAWQKPLRW